jgi:putative ABC transport system ATP-binding protein
MTLLRDIAREDHHAMIIVTHDNRVFQYADRIVAMNDGLIEREVRSHLELENH